MKELTGLVALGHMLVEEGAILAIRNESAGFRLDYEDVAAGKAFAGDLKAEGFELGWRCVKCEGSGEIAIRCKCAWRALSLDPEGVAHYADWPVNEIDLLARHKWLIAQDEFRARMVADPDFYDIKVAGWWVWGLCSWIGSGWCHTESAQLPHLGSAGQGINRKLPHLGDAGRGGAVYLPCAVIQGQRVKVSMPAPLRAKQAVSMAISCSSTSGSAKCALPAATGRG